MKPISRRGLIKTVGAGLGLGFGLRGRPACAQAEEQGLAEAVAALPCVTGHEHWGSIDAIGYSESGYLTDLRAGIEPDNASILDVIFDPYSGGPLSSKGSRPSDGAREHGFDHPRSWLRKDPAAAWKAVRNALSGLQTTGWFLCLNEGFRALYDTPLSALLGDGPGTIEKVLAIDAQVRSRYARLVAWHEEAARKLGIEAVIRPVELEYGFRADNPNERKLVTPLLRIDHFCDFYRKPTATMRFCVEKTGIDPRSAGEFREFLSRCFALAEQAGFKGTKQLQAYRRPLNYVRPRDSEVRFEATNDRARDLVFGDFVVYECAALAEKRGWPHQIHTGTDNLPDSNPLPLQPLIRAFGGVHFVLIHCWPYLKEAAYLARFNANVYVDSCWTPVLNPEFFRQSMETYIGYLPDSKVMIGHDSTSVEMAAGSLIVTRRILAEILAGRIARGETTREEALLLARAYFADTARRMYGLETGGRR
jgi:hypothetical protein